jgi:hypothetical protein
MKLVFVHGWSVTNTNTYGELPEVLEGLVPEDLDLEIHHIFLGRYISFDDEVTVDDIARAFNQARLDIIGDDPFSCITHSTGGPVIRKWVDLYYGAGDLDKLPLKHLIMLAPANHGSALAQLGKGRLGRIKAWFQGVEPGQKILDWLELGSTGQWKLNRSWLSYQPDQHAFFPFVITGQTIDSKLYDHLNSYTGEKGSDGVVRVCAANMNYRFASLKQDTEKVIRKRPLTYSLELPEGGLTTPPQTPLAVIPRASHSGKNIGIMRSVTIENAREKPVVDVILKCLLVNDPDGYKAVTGELAALSRETQDKDTETRSRFAMIVFHIHDDRGTEISDYDILLLSGRDYNPNRLPKGFFVDRQRNSVNRNRLTYYFNCTKMLEAKTLGIRITARPGKGFSYYTAGEFRSGDIPLDSLLIPNRTLYLDIELKRFVDTNVFRIFPLSDGKGSFKGVKPAGKNVP